MTKVPFYFEKCNPQTANRSQDGKRMSQDSSLKKFQLMFSFTYFFWLKKMKCHWLALNNHCCVIKHFSAPLFFRQYTVHTIIRKDSFSWYNKAFIAACKIHLLVYLSLYISYLVSLSMDSLIKIFQLLMQQYERHQHSVFNRAYFLTFFSKN